MRTPTFPTNVAPDKPSRLGWLYAYKLYHLPFWCLYHYAWWALAMGSAWEPAGVIFTSTHWVKFAFYVVFQVVGVYFNLYLLIPKFLERGRYAQYLGLLLLTIVTVAALIVPGYYVNAWLSDRTFRELYGVGPEAYFHFFKTNSLPSTLTSMLLAMSIKLTKNWIATQRKQQLLEKEQLETELKFLKSQFNPHFLFNTINSIFVLIHKNPDVASESLAKFSDLLRYQLYECNEGQIPLDRELEYFDNFIELEKLRQDHNVRLTVQVESGLSGNLTIAPFILMPFVENAFKHVSQRGDGPKWISIGLHLEGQELHLAVSNSVSPEGEQSGEAIAYGGIGLKNVQRRLNLVYPGAYDLAIGRDENQFNVRLRLTLKRETGGRETGDRRAYLYNAEKDWQSQPL
jgi:sensor histidine kinase YesM